jgi:putative phosphoribosyl transferase
VAFRVAEALDAPLDVVVVRKLGVPFRPEVAMGAIGEGGARVVDEGVLARAGVSPEQLRQVERRERETLDARVSSLRRGHERIDLTGRVAVVVDDGMATGSTARVACEVVRRLGAARVVLAVPVAPVEALRGVRFADEVVCVSTPDPFVSVGAHYRDFEPTSDVTVIRLLDAAARRTKPGPRAKGWPERPREVEIPAGAVVLRGDLGVPAGARGVVVFAHGSGSSRLSLRNRFVAGVLRARGLGTLLLDLLTPAEEAVRANVFDIELLAARLTAATRWLNSQPECAQCRVGYFGASTGAGAALWAAAEAGPEIAAVVSRGGRPDLAGPRLRHVTAPTLLIVGGRDYVVLELNQAAQKELRCPNRLAVVPGATHLFEEPDTLEQAAVLAADWFDRHLSADAHRSTAAAQ